MKNLIIAILVLISFQSMSEVFYRYDNTKGFVPTLNSKHMKVIYDTLKWSKKSGLSKNLHLYNKSKEISFYTLYKYVDTKGFVPFLKPKHMKVIYDTLKMSKAYKRNKKVTKIKKSVFRNNGALHFFQKLGCVLSNPSVIGGIQGAFKKKTSLTRKDMEDRRAFENLNNIVFVQLSNMEIMLYEDYKDQLELSNNKTTFGGVELIGLYVLNVFICALPFLI